MPERLSPSAYEPNSESDEAEGTDFEQADITDDRIAEGDREKRREADSTEREWQRYRNSQLDRIKRMARQLVEIGVISLSALAPLQQAAAIERQPKDADRQYATVQNVSSTDEINAYVREYRDRLREVEGEIQYISDTYGFRRCAEFLLLLEFGLDKQSSADATEQSAPVVTGFEGTPFASTETDKLFTVTYPDQWVTGEIDSIIYRPTATDAERTMDDHYHLGPDWKKMGEARGKESGVTSVDVYLRDNIYDIIRTASHEYGHANDWERDSQLDPADRVRLLTAVTKRFIEGDNRFYSAYVEAISNPDASEQLYDQVTEYWAEICAQYYTEPEQFAADYPDDFALVDQWVRQQDPDFDPIAASRQRDQFVQEMAAENQRRAWESLPDEAQEELAQLQSAEVDQCYRTWERTSYLENSDNIQSAVQSITDRYGADFILIYDAFLDRVFQETSQRMQAAVDTFDQGLTDAQRQSLAELNSRLQATAFDANAYARSLREWAAAHQSGTPGVVNEYLRQYSSLASP